MIKKLLLIIVSILYCNYLSAQRENVVCDSVKIYFRQSKIDLVPSLNNNKAALDRIVDSLSTSYAESVYSLQQVRVVGGASPEGSVKFNKWLSEKRAGVLFDYISHYSPLPDSLMTTHFLGRDWNGLIRLVENDAEVPYREETLALLREIAWNVANGVTTDGDPLDRLKKFHYGEPYYYMYQNLFPELRASRMFLWYRKIKNPLALLSVPEFPFVKPYEKPFSPSKRTPSPLPKKPFYMDIRTNMLYDALLVPNLGAEFYLGKNWSVVGNWKYGWWKKDRRQWYWRIYGGDIAIRKWFGKAAQKKPLTGHHLGVYGQIFTYDFEVGGRGYMGGVPGGTLWDKMNYIAGLEYGYSLPIRSRLNIDFSIGVGYWGGIYYEYLPMDNCYVWQATKQRHWFGPTKAEISLVWLIGRCNYNKEKGGRR